jgi:hypothetical protein
MKEFCEKYEITEEQFLGIKPIENGLNLPSVTELPAGFNPTVGGSLYLRSVTELPAGFNPTVSGDLYLNSVTELPAGFNPTVGGGLNLPSVTELPVGFNPTVGGGLNLDSVTKLPAEFNPTVGGGLYVNGKYTNDYKSNPNEILSWQNGKYIKADGIFTEVMHKRGNVYKVKRIGDVKESYLVTNGEFNAHGDTIKSAQYDLNFKMVAEKLKSEPIKPDTELTVMYYRTLTGACDAGCRDWMQSNEIPYTIEAGKTVEINPMTAKELLPMLEKTKPYGFEKFKELLTF